jgi:hypothetical protein
MIRTIERPNEVDLLPQSGRVAAICELTCRNCGDGLGFSQKQCDTCGEYSPRFASEAHSALQFDPRLPVAAKAINGTTAYYA